MNIKVKTESEGQGVKLSYPPAESNNVQYADSNAEVLFEDVQNGWLIEPETGQDKIVSVEHAIID